MPQQIPEIKKRWTHSILLAMGMGIFALFIHKSFPLLFLSVFGLLICAFAISRILIAHPSPASLMGIGRLSRKIVSYTSVGLGISVLLAVIYRTESGFAPFPSTLTLFALVAALIGITEEIIYRGLIQGGTRTSGAPASIAFAAFCHTAYKCALFSFSPLSLEINFLFLALATFLGGMIFGALREFSDSLLPPLVAHACFDIIVYGGSIAAPQWVWS